ncbi:MAG: A/G-specific adenine glycosylase [Trueperaceae bacterium]|nr:A/G-specific adenine glycosylase [Trueperaceae bacterium]
MTDALLDWFAEHARNLPWRRERTPYRVWVSEMMLQQTQVATVVPYFQRWLDRFPTVEALAAAPLDDVLKAWEGLGYYRRARLLHRAARQVVDDYGGALPDSEAELRRLPGIGSYTAAALMAMAFNRDAVAVDGNLKRVAARLAMLAGEVSEGQVKATLQPYLSEGRARAFNEALMDLGATVCTPKTPRCDACPVSAYCAAFAAGRVDEFPTPKRRKETPHVTRYALLYQDEAGVWLRQRGTDEMLGGLWGFVLQQTRPEGVGLEPVRHAYTHFRITATPVIVTTPPADAVPVPLAELTALALSTLDHKLLAAWRTSQSASETV